MPTGRSIAAEAARSSRICETTLRFRRPGPDRNNTFSSCVQLCQPLFDVASHRICRDAIAVMQRGQRTRIEECVGQRNLLVGA